MKSSNGRFPDGIVIVQDNCAIWIKSEASAKLIRDYLSEKLEEEAIRDAKIRASI